MMDAKMMAILQKAKMVEKATQSRDGNVSGGNVDRSYFDTPEPNYTMEAPQGTPMGGSPNQSGGLFEQMGVSGGGTPSNTPSTFADRLSPESNAYESSVNNSNMPDAIKEAMLNNPIPQPDGLGMSEIPQEFIDKIKLSLDDLLYTKDNGYIKGILNIFLKNLCHLEPTERPIHSISDKQTHQFYIKDEAGWECDKKEEQLDNSIESVSKKQLLKIKEWEAQRPDWNTTEEGIDEYMKMIKNVMGGSNDSERNENKRKIKRDLKRSFNLECASKTTT